MKTIRSAAVLTAITLSAAWIASTGGVFAQVGEGAKPKESTSPSPKKDSEKTGRPLQTFMRAKLTASTKILEGLALEDLDLVQEGALEMNKMSQAEQWRRFNDPLYRQFSAEFQQTTSDLVEAAKKGSLDRSALKWMDATMNCIDCHRYVRNQLVVGDARSPASGN